MTTTHYVQVKDSAVFVKDAAFFVEQGGLREPWGKTWEPVEADSLYDARRIAIKLRRDRYPDSHRTGGEDEPMETAWPEAKGL